MWPVVQDVGAYQTVLCEECEAERVENMEMSWWQETITRFLRPRPSFEVLRVQDWQAGRKRLGRRQAGSGHRPRGKRRKC
jgi:hypothetical protein